jgi:hypothetical protein
MRFTRKVRSRAIIAAVSAGALGLTAAGASAFTNSNTFSNSNTTVGYGTENVSGADVISLAYGLSADGSTINSVTIETSGDTSGSAAVVGFTVSGVAGATSSCGAGTYTTGSPGYTTYVCSGLSQELDLISATDIAVS